MQAMICRFRAHGKRNPPAWFLDGDGLNSRVREIGNLPTESQARLFGDYLLVQGIRNEVESNADGSWLVWVADDDQLATGKELLEKFKANPAAPEFSKGAAGADRVRAAEQKSEAAWRRKLRGREQLVPRSTTFRAGPLTFALICVCVVVALRSKFGENMDAISGLFISYLVPTHGAWFVEIKHGEFWRLFTPMFIHFGVAHLLFNMLWLFRLGSMIESANGVIRFALLILGIAGISNVAQYVLGGPGFGGMSGVNYGLFGYIWMRGKFDSGSGLYLSDQDKFLMLAWFVLCFTGWVGPIANMAHAGGLVVGLIWGWLSAKWGSRNF